MLELIKEFVCKSGMRIALVNLGGQEVEMNFVDYKKINKVIAN